MCTVFLAYKTVRDLPLIVAANRDEFYDRPSKPMHFWDDHQGVFAGRDLQANGTWLGLNQQGRFAVVTNFREPKQEDTGFQSRGQLPATFLTQSMDVATFGSLLDQERDQYRGYNLIFGSAHEGLYYYSNRDPKLQELEPGIYGLSNHLLNTPWPKVEKGLSYLTQLGDTEPAWSSATLFALLNDTEQAPDDALPDTGVGLGWERLLSATFIETFSYGTRNSTMLRFSADQKVDVEEWVYEKPGASPQKQQQQIHISA